MCKKRCLIILCVILFIESNSSSQNKLSNSSFESGNYNSSIHPAVNFDENIDSWEGRAWENPHTYEFWHSPDWKDEYWFNPNTPYGERYVAIKNYELFQQELSGSNKLEESKFYLITLQIYIDDETHEFTNLHLYYAKSKIKYKKEWSAGGGGLCSDDYRNHQDGALQSIIEIDKLDLGQFPHEEWIEIKTLFNTPQDGFTGFFINDYNWFAVETRNKSNYVEAGYETCVTLEDLCIDNISIEEVDYCSFAVCSRTDGPIVATSVLQIDNQINNPFYVTNLFNVESASSIEIKNIYGNTIRTLPNVYSVNGITYPIYWDGKTSSQSEAAPGTYFWLMNLENECGEFSYLQEFTKLTIITSYPPTNPSYSSVQTPRPCCADEPNLIISDIEISGSGEISYIAQNDIDISNVDVLSTVDDLSFQAGNSISIGPGFHIHQGATAKFFIKSCAINGPYKSDFTSQINQLGNISAVLDLNDVLDDEYPLDDKYPLDDEEGILLYPNPNDGKFYIEITDDSKQLSKIELYNVMGNKILQNDNPSENITLFDIADQESGMYLIFLYWEDQGMTRKTLILQK